jgi:hypothetical protein
VKKRFNILENSNAQVLNLAQSVSDLKVSGTIKLFKDLKE